jgi:23S rRNA G2445 N2-methylase RlmL
VAVIDTLRLIGSPETNKVMMGELSRLARRALAGRLPEPRKQGSGALIYPFDPALAMVAVHYHRTATRVLWDLYQSRAQRLEPLYEELLTDLEQDRRPWYRDGAGISVQARNVGAFAAGERQIVGTVKNAIIDGAAARGVRLHVDPEAPDLVLVARMHDDTLTVSLDLAGRSLSQRGYRQEHGPAPMREHLAAVLCMLARHDPRAEILFDPMCGAGTICIEGALMARAAPLWPADRAPALDRIPAFQDVDIALLGEPLFADTRPLVIGNDMDRRALQAARDNVRAARLAGDSRGDSAGDSVGDSVIWRQGDFRDLSPDRVRSLARASKIQPPGGLILSNPPYGHRLADPQLLALYRDLGDWCGQFRGWRAGFLVANPDWTGAFGRRARIQKPLKNGPIKGYFYLYDL